MNRGAPGGVAAAGADLQLCRMRIAPEFHPYDALAAALLPRAVGDSSDGAHDLSHLLRVWRNVQAISRREGGDGEILAAATLLHDCVAAPKDSPLRSAASRLAAESASGLLAALGWSEARIARVAHAIEAHSFSAGVAPVSLEARILQDADRLDAIGCIGVARCFYVSGRLGRAIHHPVDPAGRTRAPDDAAYALDHFRTKLLRLADGFRTPTGRALARRRHAALQAFFDELVAETSGAPATP